MSASNSTSSIAVRRGVANRAVRTVGGDQHVRFPVLVVDGPAHELAAERQCALAEDIRNRGRVDGGIAQAADRDFLVACADDDLVEFRESLRDRFARFGVFKLEPRPQRIANDRDRHIA